MKDRFISDGNDFVYNDGDQIYKIEGLSILKFSAGKWTTYREYTNYSDVIKDFRKLSKNKQKPGSNNG